MNINGFGDYQPLRRAANPDIGKAAANRAYGASEGEAAASPASSDAVSISPMARQLARLHQVPDSRADLVASLKAKLDNGELDTPEATERATGRMLSALFAGEI